MHPSLAHMAGRLAPQSDRELLGRFVRDRDGAAFAALVHRHGPTVYGACRRVLGNPADAEDAFQAVFLVLAARADALTHRPALGGWLHEVAVRVALKARTALARLRKHERQAALARRQVVATDPTPADPPAWLDRELAALPDRLREPVVRCLVQGRPRAEVAAELGIPEGTLASRLDAARKRLAGRLARYRVSPTVNGLLVPVPAALATAAVARATDGTGGFVHQLAREVTKAMTPTTKWVTLAAVAALTAAGGGLASVAVGPPGGPPVASPAVRPAEPPAKPALPEPAWMAGFRKTYELKDGEFVKRVAPPYIPERVDFHLDQLLGGKRYAPEVEAGNRRRAADGAMFYTVFVEQDGRKLTQRDAISSMYLMDRPEKRQGNNLLTVVDAVSSVTGFEPPEYVIDPKAKDDPLFADDNKTVHGDFVTRKGAPLDKLAPQLEAILRNECKADLRLTLREEEQDVFVVGGAFQPKPPEWRPKGELDLYATEGGLNRNYDHFDHKKRRADPLTQVVYSTQYSGTPTSLVRFVGHRLGTRMVWDAPLPDEPRLSWINHLVRNPTEEEAAADRDPDKVLKVVAGQTGLTFKKERRKVTVLVLGVPEKR